MKNKEGMKMKNKEVRLLDVELRTPEEDDKMIVEGYAITFNSPATHGYTEIISDKALDNTDMSDVPLKYNHEDSHLIMARTRNKSLELKKDEKGLFIRAELIDTQSNKDIYKSIKAGLIDKMSFAFTTRGDEYDYDTDTRTITDIDKLYDVSVVDMPFYDSTSVYARNENDEFLTRREELRKQHELEVAEEERKAKLQEAKDKLLAKLG